MKKIRIFKLNSKTTKDQFFAQVKKICKNTSGTSYNIMLDGDYLKMNDKTKVTLEDYNVSSNDNFVIEFKD